MKKNFILFILLFLNTFLYSQNIEMVKDINPNGSSIPQKLKVARYKESMTSTPTRLFFMANDDQGKGVFLTDGTETGTKKILSNITNAYGFISFNTLNFLVQSPTVLFICENANYGAEIWRTNGTINTTQLLKDIYTGTSSSYPSNIVPLNFQAYFAATSSLNLRSIYSTTGTAAETQIAIPFNSGANSMIYYIDTLNNHLIFAAYTLQNGAELWISDGTEAGTQLVKEIASGNANAFDTLYGAIKFSPVHFNGKIFFNAKNNTNNNEPWFSDGTTAGTLCLKEINPNGGSNPTNFVVCNNHLYFFAWDGTEYGIYETDGTVNNADKVASIGLNLPSKLFAYNNSLYYFNNNGMLIKYDVQNHVATDIKQFNLDPYGITSMIEYNGYLYFSAYRSGNYELWRTDGSIANTIQLLPPNAVNSGSPSSFTEYDGSLYFAANFMNEGLELWKLTDSTTLLPPMFNVVNKNSIYPNPAKEFITIQSLTSENFYIYNSMGKLVLSSKNNKKAISIDQLSSGLYLVRDEKNNFIGKFIKE